MHQNIVISTCYQCKNYATFYTALKSSVHVMHTEHLISDTVFIRNNLPAFRFQKVVSWKKDSCDTGIVTNILTNFLVTINYQFST